MRSAEHIPAELDVAVVGGGIIGLAVAWELAERGRDVVLFDDAGREGNSTRAAAGMLAPAAEADVDLPGLCEFRRFSHSLYPEFVARLEERSGIDTGFRTTGTLLVGLDRDHRAEIERLRSIMMDQGFAPRVLAPDEILALEPSLSPRVTGGLFLSQDFHVDQRRLVQALCLALERRTQRPRHEARVERVDADGRVRGVAAGEVFETRATQVVVAAGSWSNVDLVSPCAPLPLRPVRGQVLRLHAPGMLAHVVRTPDVYVVPHAGGQIVVGATVEEQGFDARPTAGGVLDLLRHAWRVLPGIYDCPLLEVAVGFRPCARDHRPLIGHVRGNVFAATGHFRNGILLAPGTARLLAFLLCDGAAPPLQAHFDPQRLLGAATVGAGGNA